MRRTRIGIGKRKESIESYAIGKKKRIIIDKKRKQKEKYRE